MLVFSNDEKTPRYHVLANLLFLTSWSIPRLADPHLPNPSTDKDCYFWPILATIPLYLATTAWHIKHPVQVTHSRCMYRLALPSLLSLVLIKVCGQISDEHYTLRLISGYSMFFAFPLLAILAYRFPPDPVQPEPSPWCLVMTALTSRMICAVLELDRLTDSELRERQMSETVYFFICLVAALICLAYIATTFSLPTSDRVTHDFTVSLVSPAVCWFVILCCRFLPDISSELRYRIASRTWDISLPIILFHAYVRQRSYTEIGKSIQDNIKSSPMWWLLASPAVWGLAKFTYNAL